MFFFSLGKRCARVGTAGELLGALKLGVWAVYHGFVLHDQSIGGFGSAIQGDSVFPVVECTWAFNLSLLSLVTLGFFWGRKGLSCVLLDYVQVFSTTWEYFCLKDGFGKFQPSGDRWHFCVVAKGLFGVGMCCVAPPNPIP